MISGAHSIIYSSNPDADRAFLRDVLKLPHVDVGGGWLIFGLPPAEVAVHPSDGNDVHELYLMSDDIEGFAGEMAAHGIGCGPVLDRGWGLLVELSLPGGGKLGVYQPRHARPANASPGTKAAKTPARKRAKAATPGKAATRKGTQAATRKQTATRKSAAHRNTKPARKTPAKKTRKR